MNKVLSADNYHVVMSKKPNNVLDFGGLSITDKDLKKVINQPLNDEDCKKVVPLLEVSVQHIVGFGLVLRGI